MCVDINIHAIQHIVAVVGPTKIHCQYYFIFYLQVVGVIAAALEKHAAHAVPRQTGTLGVGMQAASGVSKGTAAQQADHAANAASAEGDVSAFAVEVRCRRTGSPLTFCEVMIALFTVLYAVQKNHMVLSLCAYCVSFLGTSVTVLQFTFSYECTICVTRKCFNSYHHL